MDLANLPSDVLATTGIVLEEPRSVPTMSEIDAAAIAAQATAGMRTTRSGSQARLLLSENVPLVPPFEAAPKRTT